MNPNVGQWLASVDAERKNIIGQRPASHSPVSKLLLLIYKGGIFGEKKTANERLFWLIQTTLHCPLHG